MTQAERRRLLAEATLLMQAAGTQRFAELVALVLRRSCEFDLIHISLNSLGRTPIELFSPTRTRVYIDAMALYIAGAYALDPFLLHWERNPSTWSKPLCEVMPHGFTRSKYYSMFYSSLQLVDELYTAIRIDDERWVAISMGRIEGGKFGRSTLIALKDRLELLESGFRLNRRLYPEQYNVDDNNTNNEKSAVEKAFERFGARRLTPRERQVCWLLLSGHSSKSIAMELDLSPGTIKVHRKNIYAELGCNSLSDLFSQFISQLQADR